MYTAELDGSEVDLYNFDEFIGVDSKNTTAYTETDVEKFIVDFDVDVDKRPWGVKSIDTSVLRVRLSIYYKVYDKPEHENTEPEVQVLIIDTDDDKSYTINSVFDGGKQVTVTGAEINFRTKTITVNF